jgi:2-hydroxy-6-oxonona-2,4-dienedioate hydrolase
MHHRQILFVILAVLIIGTAGVYAIFVHDLAAARVRLVGRSKTMETSFGTSEYAVMGEGAPMLIVHGAEGGFDQGIDMTGALAERGYQPLVGLRSYFEGDRLQCHAGPRRRHKGHA